MPKNGNIRLWVAPQFDDVAFREHLNIFFLRDKRVEEVDSKKDADFCVIDIRYLKDANELDNHDKYIVLSLGDIYTAMGSLQIRDDDYRKYLLESGKTLIYLLCEPEPCIPFSIEEGFSDLEDTFEIVSEENQILLTMPLGYAHGPKINVHYESHDTSALFVNNFTKSKKEYDYDWCWIGVRSSADRKIIMKELYQRALNGTRTITNLTGLGIPTFPYKFKPVLADAVFIETEICKEEDYEKRKELLNSDRKTVPFDQYIQIIKRSKVNICCNGFGMWCPRDGEFFSRNCFNLRQWHKNLYKNPLTPENGKHWVVFKNSEFNDLLTYYVNHDREREIISDNGYEYFKESIEGGWAKYYTDHLQAYMQTGSAEAFGRLRWDGKDT